MPRYPLSKQLIQKAFDLICAHKSLSMSALRMSYATQLFVTESQVRSWQSGAARPDAPSEIELLARDAIHIARLDEEWLRSFLREMNASLALRDGLLAELKQREPSHRLGTATHQAYDVHFQNGNIARAINTVASDEISQYIQEVGLPTDRPTLLVIGGADGLDEEYSQRLRPILEEVLIPLCEKLQVTVIDGGTNSGVMRLLGTARCKAKATFPLVGIAAIGTVQLPNFEQKTVRVTPIEPNHSHFILVPGTQWSNESRWLVEIAHKLAGQKPSFTLVLNGGEITWADIAHSMFVGRPVLALDGSGRAADAFSAALRGEIQNERAKLLEKTGLARYIDIKDAEAFACSVEQFLLQGKWPNESIH